MLKRVILIALLLTVATIPTSTGGDVRTDGEESNVGIHYASYFGGENEDRARAIHVDDEGMVYIAFSMSSNFPQTIDHLTGESHDYEDLILKIDTITGDLIYSMRFNGPNIYGMTTDGNGSLYVTGHYSGADLPTNYYAFNQDNMGKTDAFVTKFSANGTEILYSTYIGGSLSDYGKAIAVDEEGNAFIFGETMSTDFPTESEGVHAHVEGSYDNFIVKLGPRGQEILGTLTYGTEDREFAYKCELGPDGALYLGGGSKSVEMATISMGYRAQSLGDTDIHVIKLDTEDLDMDYLALVGGSGIESSCYLEVDMDGAVYVATSTESVDFPYTPGALKQTPLNGSVDCVVFKLDPTGNDLEFSARFGGNKGSWCDGIALAEDGTIMVTGVTDSTDFPTTMDALNPDAMGNYDIFYMEISGEGSELRYSTLLGSDAGDYYTKTDFGPDTAHIVTYTFGDLISVTENAYQEEKSGGGDSFLYTIDRAPPSVTYDGSTLYTTEQNAYAFSVGLSDNLYVASAWVEYWFGSGDPQHDELELVEGSRYEGDWIAFVQVNDASSPMHYVVHARDQAGNEVATEKVTRSGDSESPQITSDTSDTEGVLGRPVTFEVTVEDDIGILEVSVVIKWMGTSETHKMEQVGGSYSLTVTVPRNATRHAADYAIYYFKISDMARNLLRPEEVRIPLVNIPPEVQPLPKWKVRPNEQTEMDLAPYISDGNDVIANLTINTDNTEVDVQGTVLRALFTKDFTKKTILIEISDGDDKTLTNLTIVNPDAPDDAGGLPGPSAILMVMAMVVAWTLVWWTQGSSRTRRRGEGRRRAPR